MLVCIISCRGKSERAHRREDYGSTIAWISLCGVKSFQCTLLGGTITSPTHTRTPALCSRPILALNWNESEEHLPPLTGFVRSVFRLDS